MAKKVGKYYSLDLGVVQDFEEICKKRDQEFSATVQQLMENFIAKDGEMVMDDLFAPRMNEMIKRTVRNELNGVKSMLYNLQVDTTANLYSVPAIYKKTVLSIEDVISHFLDERVLNDNAVSQGEQFSFNVDGMKMVGDLRNYARDDIKKQKIAKGAETQL